LVTIAVAQFAIVADNSAMAAVLPQAARSLDVPLASVTVLTTAYLLAFSAGLLTAGPLVARIRPRATFLLGFMLFGGASAWATQTNDITMLTACRGAQGLGAALLAMTALAHVVTLRRPEAKNDVALASWGIASALAAPCGYATGGFLSAVLGWHSALWTNVLVAVVGVVAASCMSVSTAAAETRLRIGVLRSMVGVLAVVALVYGASSDTGGAVRLALAGAALILLAGLLSSDYLSERPLIPLPLRRSQSFSRSCLSIGVGQMAAYGALFVVPIALLRVRGLSTLDASLVLMAYGCAAPVGALVSALLVTRRNPGTVAVGGACGMSAALVVLALCPLGGTTATLCMVAALALLAVGAWSYLIALNAAALDALTADHALVASTILTVVQQVGGAVGLVVVGLVIDGFQPDRIEQATRASFYITASLAVVAALLARALATVSALHRPLSAQR
jgi:MFS family permease